MGQRNLYQAAFAIALMVAYLSGCQGKGNTRTTTFRPLVTPVAADLSLTYQIGQFNGSQGGVLTNVVNRGSALPLNQQLVNAVAANDWETAEHLLTHGAVPDAGDYVTGYALPVAADNNNLRVVSLLVDRGADVNISGQDGETALAKAIKQGNLEVVEFLLRKGAYPNRGVMGQPPLVLAIQTGRPEMVELLLKYGANPKPEATSLLEATTEAQEYAQAQFKSINQMLAEAGAE